MMIAPFRVRRELPPEGEDVPEEEPPKENITQLNDAIREMISRNHFGGILLHGENIADAGGLARQMLEEMQALPEGAAPVHIPALDDGYMPAIA